MRKLNLRIAFAVFGSLLASPFVAHSDECWAQSSDPCGAIRLDFGVDFIYWKPCIDELDFALKSKDILNPDVAAPFDPRNGPVVGKYKYLDPRGQGGVRAYLGKNCIWNGWGLFFSYTYAASSACNGFLKSPSGHVWPTLMHGQQIFAGNSVFAEYRLHYQTFDALLTNAVECGECGNLHPFFGFDSLYLFQELSSKATDVVDSLIGRSFWQSDLYGAGIKVGLEYDYEVCEGIGIYAKASGSILSAQHSSRFKGERECIKPEVNLVITNGVLKFKSREGIIVPGYSLAFGAYTETSCQETHVNLHIGYEFIQWFNIPNQGRFPANGVGIARHYPNSSTQLGLHGVTAGFNIEF